MSSAAGTQSKTGAVVSDSLGATVGSRAREMAEQIARRVASAAPTGWQRMVVTFALTVDQSLARVSLEAGGKAVQFGVDAETMRLAREQRELTAGQGAVPWWRMILRLEVDGEFGIEYDYGEEPFPEGWLFAPQSYKADLARFPRERIPVWLAAYLRHDGRQTRTPQRAAADARSDAEHGVRPNDSSDLLPEPALLWSRWAVLSAAFVAAGSPLGPRVAPSLGVFEGAFSRSGSTLYMLPGGRAVLSGGVWDAPELDAAYNGGRRLPHLYAGAPNWVADSVLNPRAGTGLLSFCYWHDGRRWYRGQSPLPDDFGTAIPGVVDPHVLTTLMLQCVSPEPTAAQQKSVAALIAAAEAGVVTRRHLTAAFDVEDGIADAALYQLEIAGRTAALSHVEENAI
ncbi:hypothetical protein ABIA39_001096 [Nocardia sp. GAS34]|uniref:hypothetical protein n=1 Tax=unclassified Nocardia TaxID=2637762 RepID=UPI003D1BADB4